MYKHDLQWLVFVDGGLCAACAFPADAAMICGAHKAGRIYYNGALLWWEGYEQFPGDRDNGEGAALVMSARYEQETKAAQRG